MGQQDVIINCVGSVGGLNLQEVFHVQFALLQ